MFINATNDAIYNTLKDEIMLLKLKPGSLVSETELSSRFNVSRTPVRQVLRKLSEEGLIDIVPQKGSFVSLIDLKYIDDIIFMRLALETEIIEAGMSKLTEENLKELNDNLSVQKCLIDHDTAGQDLLLEFNRLDNAFHQKLYELADKKNLWDIISKLSQHYVRYRILDMFDKDTVHKLYDEHVELLYIIVNHDIEKVRNHLESHLKGGYSRLSHLQAEFHFYMINNYK